MKTALPAVGLALYSAFVPDLPLEVLCRPGWNSAVFGTIQPGDTVSITVITENGWLGFDPGTAQAAFTGSFRYRWIPPDPSVDTCGLDTVWAPGPGVTYALSMGNAPVFSIPDTSSAPLGTMGPEWAAAVLAEKGNWLLVDLDSGPDPGEGRGWVRLLDVSLSRP